MPDALHGWYDVLVVGASSAGLRAAELLALQGQRVLVLERRSALDQIDRTWIVTPHLHRVLGYLPNEALKLVALSLWISFRGKWEERGSKL